MSKFARPTLDSADATGSIRALAAWFDRHISILNADSEGPAPEPVPPPSTVPIPFIQLHHEEYLRTMGADPSDWPYFFP